MTPAMEDDFTRGLRSVQFAKGWLNRLTSMQRLLHVVDRWMLAVRYDGDGIKLDLVEPSDVSTYAWCGRCRLNKDHDLVDAQAMRVRCRICADEHEFKAAG